MLLCRWALGATISDPCKGIWAGICAFAWEMLNAWLSLIRIPYQGCVHNGHAGLLMGMVASMMLLLLRVLYAPIILLDRLCTGFANCTNSCNRMGHLRKRLDHCFDPEAPLIALSQAPKGKESGSQNCCGPPLCRRDAGNIQGSARFPLHGPYAEPTDERRASIEAAFARLILLRRAFDTLDLHSGDGVLSASEVKVTRPCPHMDACLPT